MGVNILTLMLSLFIQIPFKCNLYRSLMIKSNYPKVQKTFRMDISNSWFSNFSKCYPADLSSAFAAFLVCQSQHDVTMDTLFPCSNWVPRWDNDSHSRKETSHTAPNAIGCWLILTRFNLYVAGALRPRASLMRTACAGWDKNVETWCTVNDFALVYCSQCSIN